MFALIKCLAVAIALLASATASATFPERTVKIVVAFSAGGTNDSAARLIGEKMQDILKQPFIVENKPGAGGMIGAEAVASAAPDGYTLFMASGGHTVLPALYKTMRYDLVKDFVPVGLACISGYAIIVPAASPAHSLADLVALGKKDGNLNYAVTGTGVLTHLAGEWLKQVTGMKATYVPYKGDSPALADLLGSQVDYSVLSITPALPHIKQNTLRALAVTSDERSSALPDVPTVSEELGIKEFNITTWFGLLAPAKTPPEVVQILSTTLSKVLALPEVQAKFRSQAMEPGNVSPQEYGEIIKRDIQRASNIAKSIGIKPE